MAYRHKELTGKVFKNDRKSDEKHADYGGTVVVGGQEYWINLHIRNLPKNFFGAPNPFYDPKKKPYMAVSLSPKGEARKPVERKQSSIPSLAPPPDMEQPPDRPLDPVDPDTGEYKF